MSGSDMERSLASPPEVWGLHIVGLMLLTRADSVVVGGVLRPLAQATESLWRDHGDLH